MRLIFISLVALISAGCSSLPLLDGERSSAGVVTSDTGPSVEPDLTDPAEASRLAKPQAPVKVIPPVRGVNRNLFEEGLALMAAGDGAAAEVLFTRITVSQPELAGPWVNIGLIRAERKDENGALDAFAQALKANPNNCDALNQLGVMARGRGEFAEAEANYRSCLDYDPTYAAAYLNLGVLYELYMGRFGEALAAYQDYQLMLDEPDQLVAGWLLDLERRVASLAAR